jgi:nucleoside-triphosphatase THEP1
MLFLWTGPRHSGKTTSALRLAGTAKQHGFRVAGLLAPSVYRDEELVGFDAMDLRSEIRVPLAIRRDRPGDVGPFHFLEEGLRLGRHALDAAATEGADLVIVDEFGPLEIAQRGWRGEVDSLVHADRTSLLVVRQELAGTVRRIYAAVPSRLVDAAAAGAVNEVVCWLEKTHAA